MIRKSNKFLLILFCNLDFITNFAVKTKNIIKMNTDLKNKCHAIIHSCSIADAGGNAIPVTGTGFAADILAMTTMTMSLAAAFGRNIEKAVARGLAIAALKKQVCKGPIKILSRELVKIVPWGGQAAAAAISLAMMEAAGWSLVTEFENGQI